MPGKKETGLEIFPKIAAEAKIKNVTMSDSAKINFEDLKFSPEQYATLERWREYGENIRITLQQIQATIK